MIKTRQVVFWYDPEYKHMAYRRPDGHFDHIGYDCRHKDIHPSFDPTPK